MNARRSLAVALAVVATVLLAGCSSHTTATPTVTASGVSSADVMFAQMMIPHHAQAVVMADLAATRASDPKIIDLAAQIKAAQQPEIDLMTSWLQAWGAPVLSEAEAMDSHAGHGMSGMLTAEHLDELEAASGAAFDQRFAELMIEHHLGAVDMARTVERSGDPAVAGLARELITTQETEIAELQAFLDGS